MEQYDIAATAEVHNYGILGGAWFDSITPTRYSKCFFIVNGDVTRFNMETYERFQAKLIYDLNIYTKISI